MLRTLASDFGSSMVLTPAFMQDMFGTSNKMKVRDNAHKFCRIMASQGCDLERDSEPVLCKLFWRLPDWLRRVNENACQVNGEYVPSYNALVSCVTDALKKQLSNFGDWESVDKRTLEKSVPG